MMTSNSTFRSEFGILDPKTKKPYKDIICAFMKSARLSKALLSQKYLLQSKDSYLIHFDRETREYLISFGEADCVLSYQKRIDGNYVMIRLYKPSLIKNSV